MGQRWVLASAAALVAAAACCPSAGAIINGGPETITQHPYQVALLNNAIGVKTTLQPQDTSALFTKMDQSQDYQVVAAASMRE